MKVLRTSQVFRNFQVLEISYACEIFHVTEGIKYLQHEEEIEQQREEQRELREFRPNMARIRFIAESHLEVGKGKNFRTSNILPFHYCSIAQTVPIQKYLNAVANGFLLV